MKVSQRQVVSIKHTTKDSHTNKSCLSPSQALYCIEEIKKFDNISTIHLHIRNLATNERYVKHPLSLYCDKEMLNLFSSNDIRIIMTYVIFKLDKNQLEPIEFNGYDYSQDRELEVNYDKRFKKTLIKKHDNNSLS